MATQTTSGKTDFSNFNSITDFLEWIYSKATIKPSFVKIPGTDKPMVDLQGNKTLQGFVAVNLDSEISDILTDEKALKSLESSVRTFKNHWNVFPGDSDSEMLCFGKFSNMSKAEYLAEASEL
jgi:hypothetical protein